MSGFLFGSRCKMCFRQTFAVAQSNKNTLVKGNPSTRFQKLARPKIAATAY